MKKGPKVLKKSKRQTGTSNRILDEQRSALSPGQRLSANGNKYSEYRKNRTDVGNDMKKKVVKIRDSDKLKDHNRHIAIKKAKSSSSKGVVASTKKIPLKHIIWEWNEGKGLGYAGKEFKTWDAFNAAIAEVYTNYIEGQKELDPSRGVGSSAGYDKVKFTIIWEDGTKLIDRVDVGYSNGDYHMQEPVGAFIKRGEPMYESTIKQGTRGQYDWGEDSKYYMSWKNPVPSSPPKKQSDLPELNSFSGSSKYFNVMNVKVTEGVKYLMLNGYSWLVTDAIVILRMKPKVTREEFVVIQLKLKDGEGIVKYGDGNGNSLFSQKYLYTDAQTEVKLFYTDGVLMLSGEY